MSVEDIKKHRNLLTEGFWVDHSMQDLAETAACRLYEKHFSLDLWDTDWAGYVASFILKAKPTRGDLKHIIQSRYVPRRLAHMTLPDPEEIESMMHNNDDVWEGKEDSLARQLEEAFYRDSKPKKKLINPPVTPLDMEENL